MSNCQCFRPCHRGTTPLDLIRNRPCYLAQPGRPVFEVPGLPTTPVVPGQPPVQPPTTPPVNLPPPILNPPPVVPPEEPLPQPPQPPALTLGQLLIQETNQARQDPQGYAQVVQSVASQSTTSFDPALVQQAIAFLQTATPCANTLVEDPTLDQIAQDWVNTAGPAGIIGHGDFAARVQNALASGEYLALGENLAYGYTDARTIVAAWIISPPHRANIFNCNFDRIGVGAGPHNSAFNFMVANVYGDAV